MPGSEGLLQRTWAKQSRCFRNETLPMPLRSMPPMPLRSMPPPPDRCARTPRLKNQALLAIRGITLANRARLQAVVTRERAMVAALRDGKRLNFELPMQ